MNFAKSISIENDGPVTQVFRVNGGDINVAWCLHTKNSKYFLKVNDAAAYPGMFTKEAEGLAALRNTGTVNVPLILKYGEQDSRQYLLMDWVEREAPAKNFWQSFGTSLAQLHQAAQPFFGWMEDNYIGSLHQQNTQHSNWHSFYCECRIMPLVKKLFDAGRFDKADIAAAENLCIASHNLFPLEYPSLLHGDLWSGNFMAATNGLAVIYDPAVYFGHREMDIGMTKLFGGFHQDFYNAYNEIYPLEEGWQDRLQLTQLYPLLVHAVLFGGHYISNASEIIGRF